MEEEKRQAFGAPYLQGGRGRILSLHTLEQEGGSMQSTTPCTTTTTSTQARYSSLIPMYQLAIYLLHSIIHIPYQVSPRLATYMFPACPNERHLVQHAPAAPTGQAETRGPGWTPR
ncbi:hypothetical protein E2C01_083555 [Portunus trituberculatus]|uniref:Uncharacterized protein n=1 Tax=Portunus trituberculatus TaxID=210409 RepID=A0A5B7J236_PORTR|nr:hypothetical protein [Portunus trituberculatus]